MKPTSLGIIGCGQVLAAYKAALLPLLHRGSAKVAGICGRREQAQAALEGMGDEVRFHTRSQDVIHDPQVDAVLILTSMPQHAELARAALKAGKHVLVEKTMAGTAREAHDLVELAQRQGQLLLAAPFTTLSPTWVAMARCLQNGGIGKPCSARARYGWAGPDWSPWFYQPGGGCLLDLAVYNLTSLTGLLGPALRVTALTGICIPQRTVRGQKIKVQVEDNAHLLLDFGQACFASVLTGFTIQQYRGPALEIYGTTGTLQMLGDDWDPDGFEWWENKVGAWKTYKETHPDWSWTDGLNHFIDCIQNHRTPRTSTKQSCHVIEILEAARKSSREGRTIPLRTAFEPPPLPKEAAQEAAHLIHDRSQNKSAERQGHPQRRSKRSRGGVR